MNVVISGTVGAGKSTVSELLAKKLNYNVMIEPAETNPYLEGYYNDTKNFAFKMQIYMLMIRSKQLKNMILKDNIIFDRSIIEDPVFVEVLREQGNFNDIDYQTYYDFYNNVMKSTLYFDPVLKPDLIVYLKISTDNAIKRINNRGRESELSTGYDYWDLLNKKYEDWYLKNKNDLNFLVIDVNNKTPEEIVKTITLELKKKKYILL